MKIARFEQSFSKLYIRSIELDPNSQFDCWVFFGVEFLKLSDIFEITGEDAVSVVECVGVSGVAIKEFRFSAAEEQIVRALSMKKGKAIDYPQVPLTTVVSWFDCEGEKT